MLNHILNIYIHLVTLGVQINIKQALCMEYKHIYTKMALLNNKFHGNMVFRTKPYITPNCILKINVINVLIKSIYSVFNISYLVII